MFVIRCLHSNEVVLFCCRRRRRFGSHGEWWVFLLSSRDGLYVMDYWAQERRLLKQRQQMVKVLSKLLAVVNEEIDEVIAGNGVCAEGSYDDDDAAGEGEKINDLSG